MLIGNLTRDPELRYTPQGTAVCTMGIATNRSWTPSDGSERQEETEYHRIVAWAKLAEICSQLLNKGRKVYVEGRLQTRKWQTQEGTERETTEIVIDNMIALGAPKGSSSANQSDDYESMGSNNAPTQSTTSKVAGSVNASTVVGDSSDDDASTGDSADDLPEDKPEKEAPASKPAATSGKKKTEEVSADDIPF